MGQERKRAKKPTRTKKSFIKHDQFLDRNISPLESHPRQGKTLKNPFSVIPSPMTPRSWVNECIPNILWACILTASLDREHYLRLFRTVACNIREELENYSELFVTHNFISKFSDREFDVAFRYVLADEKASSALSALLLVDCLPDKQFWKLRLPAPTDDHWQVLARAVGVCFNHQSQQATDIRWIKLIFLAITGRVHFPREQADLVKSRHSDRRRAQKRAPRSTAPRIECGVSLMIGPDVSASRFNAAKVRVNEAVELSVRLHVIKSVSFGTGPRIE